MHTLLPYQCCVIFIYDVITVLRQRVATLWTDCGLGCSSWFVILLHSLLHPWFSHWVWDKPAVCLLVHLRVVCFFFVGFWVLRCFLLPLYYTPLPHTVCWHQAETASCCTRSWCVCWWCVITSPSCWVLIRYSAVMSWSDSSGCDGLIVSSVRLCGILSPKPWMSAATNLPAFSPPAVNTGFWLLSFYWPPICPACFLVS